MSNVHSLHGVRMKVTNKEFMGAIFSDEWGAAHVTAFADDPSAIPENRRGLCWGGGSASRLIGEMTEAQNQYFCISLFNSPRGTSLRQKKLFDACFVIVADDVREKLPVERVEMLPLPSYKLTTSEGSEQWGWILDEPCADRDVVENLLDGLVAKGLAPDGTDPGMKGVTRYVRLPGGSNTKAKKRDNYGNPFKCFLSEWNPQRMYSIEDLGNTFGINLYAHRTENNSAGEIMTSDVVMNHPIIKGGLLRLTGEGSDGWIRCDCPNAANHSDGDPSGAAVQIKSDGTVFFQCHHGHCNGENGTKLTGTKVVDLLDRQHGTELKKQIVDYKETLLIEGMKALVATGIVPKHGSAKEVAEKGDDRQEHDEGDFDPNDWIFISSINKFYRVSSGVEVSHHALDSLYLDQFPKRPKASERLLRAMDKTRQLADGYTWLPTTYGMVSPLIINHGNKRYINQWEGFAVTPIQGSVNPWLDLLKFLVPDEEQRSAVLWWLAHKVQHPDIKIQWQILMLGSKGTGKDSLMAPVMQMFGAAANDITGEDMNRGWGDYMAKKVMVTLQEIYREQDRKYSNMMKTFAASTSTGLKAWNMKGGAIVFMPDVVGFIGFSNHRHCMAIEPGERRYLVLENFCEKESPDFYARYHDWKNNSGAAKLFNYLLNYDLRNSPFNVGVMPIYTPAYYDLVEGGKADYESVIEEMYHSRESVFALHCFCLKTLISALRQTGHSMGQKGVIRAIEGLGYRKYRGQIKVNGDLKSTPTFYSREDISHLSLKNLYHYYFKTDE